MRCNQGQCGSSPSTESARGSNHKGMQDKDTTLRAEKRASPTVRRLKSCTRLMICGESPNRYHSVLTNGMARLSLVSSAVLRVWEQAGMTLLHSNWFTPSPVGSRCHGPHTPLLPGRFHRSHYTRPWTSEVPHKQGWRQAGGSCVRQSRTCSGGL